MNIVAGKTVAPELIQHEATPERIAAEVMAILQDDQRRRIMKEELSQLREKLGRPGAARRAADLALSLLEMKSNG
ncbi:MAG: lipid-A-disaccharide synthase [Syntrophus sp. PtaU1.Bin208]|nr:MAG: lipid-A-disaccharide synthase [Syntrophus sp. PtaU1.Bin208]